MAKPTIQGREIRLQRREDGRLYTSDSHLFLEGWEIQVSSFGVTWVFDEPKRCGKYCNGEWWVLGPVTITSITPESVQVGSRWINGTEVNPNSDSVQGYDSSPRYPYRHALNRAPSVAGPLYLTAGSVVSSVSGVAASSTGPALDETAILTVVDEIPAADAFRPDPYSVNPTKASMWTESQLDYSILQSLPKVGNVPSMSSALSDLGRLFSEQGSFKYWQAGTKARNAHPSGTYGRNTAMKLGNWALMLHLDFTNAEKRDLFVGMVQYGLDIYGRLVRGGRWHADGGINHGRKFPMILAGLALNDADILARASRDLSNRNTFQEDGQTFYITQGDIDNSNYTQDVLGLPEWSTKYWAKYKTDGDYSTNLDGQNGWATKYRYAGSQFVAHALAARLTPGAVAAWNWPAFFDYCDRFVDVGGSDPVGSTNGITVFANNMWQAYRGIS